MTTKFGPKDRKERHHLEDTGTEGIRNLTLKQWQGVHCTRLTQDGDHKVLGIS
jgi:hypothetical protein